MNIILDWLFIIPLGMGTAGAALATSLGYAASTGYYFWCVFSQKRKGNDVLSISLKGVRESGKIAGSVVKIGVPGALITVMLSVSNIVLNSHVALYGSDAVACYGIAYKLSLFAMLLSVGLAQGIAPLFGFYYGARQTARLHKAVYIGGAFDILLGAAFAAAFVMFGRPLAGLFLDDKALIAQSASFLGVIGLSAPTVGVTNIITSYFQALGKAMDSMLITMLRNVILFIPGVVLMNALWHLSGVIATQPTVELIVMLMSIVLYVWDQKRDAMTTHGMGGEHSK